jgi:Eco57I restriction-modification methylase
MLDTARAREYVKSFNFTKLFIEELGWDRHTNRLDVPVDGQVFNLTGVAQKKGMVAFSCEPRADGQIPDHATRRKIERQVSKSVHEHLILYLDKDRTTQIWQWVKREPGKPTACREHTYHRSQSGDALVQKLQAIAFSLAEEETLTIIDVTRRARKAFDVERVTKRFYDEFRKQHAAFLKFITGIPVKEDQEWYGSVMLNRLMFIYFIQRKGFLDGHHDYLRNRLIRTKREFGKDKFYSFYRYFLLRLFHEGLGGRERTPELEELLGRIPYLNGGLFDIHELERPDRYGKAIQIPDEAFEAIFDYFDRWHWHLDERPLRADNEINPGVLGYIFEKYINQKQMGAYYTEEDITEYISKNTVIPFLFDAARAKCKIAFDNPNGPTIWDLLKADPERYIYPAVLHGKDKPLPANIAAGLNEVSQRTSWNKPAPAEFALPTEIWREVVARRKRCEELHAKLAGGEIRDINDLITLNLNIRQFAQDVIENCEGPELLRAFWLAIERVTILDTTAGSGAFLFAALNVLEPLYEACLDRMEAFVGDLDRSGEKHRPEKFSDFRKVLENVAAHPNRRYFIFKSIILNNLFGVDTMEEAVEICKLRLFLKLAAQVEPDATKDNFGIEPLPDIDFNIRAGNTLVGYATADEVRRAFKEGPGGQGKLLLGDSSEAYRRFEEQVESADRAFKQFRVMQTEHGMDAKDFVNAKQTLRERLKALQEELNRYLASDYGVKANDKNAYRTWLKSHHPFHWFVEFYGIVSNGGFDVIIGNPPYLEIREVDYKPKNYSCLESGAIHAMCIERSGRLLDKKGCMSMIVPLSLPSTQRMQVVQQLLEIERNAWYANYAWRPAKLFNTVNRALTIFVVTPSINCHTYSTNYQKWTSDDRDGLFQRLKFVEVLRTRPAFWVPKLGDPIEQRILEKCLAVKTATKHFAGASEHRVYYRTTGGLYWKVFTDFPPAFRLKGKEGRSSRETWFTLANREHVKPVVAALSSNVFWWWYTVTSNLRDLNPFDIQNFPLPESALRGQDLRELGRRYLKDIDRNSTMLVREQKQTGRTETQSFKIQKSKLILDEIDRVLAAHYGFTDEELDFIINYDIKYRMGRDAENEEE